MNHASEFLAETIKIANKLDPIAIERLASELERLKGRLYLVGLGGSAANCIHAAADFRRLCGIDAVALMENISELTARANDDGWHTIFAGRLRERPSADDALMVFSVGGGTEGVSVPLVKAIDWARAIGMRVLGIVGRDGGATAKNANAVVLVPTVHPDRVTPHTEAWQMVVVHLLVSHPALQKARTKW